MPIVRFISSKNASGLHSKTKGRLAEWHSGGRMRWVDGQKIGRPFVSCT